MHLPVHDSALDPQRQREHDRRRLWRAFNASLAFVLLLLVVFSAQQAFDWRALAIAPQTLAGLPGVLTAPLLHGSPGHVGANAVSLLLLGTLAGTVYPRATLRALPLLWLGSGLGAWLLGDAGSHHLGASGLGHGLMFLVFALGLLRRDRAAIAAAMIAFMLYGGMLLTVLPREPGVSWQAHLGGAFAGLVAAWLFRRSDPLPPRKRYSWELEEEQAARAAALADADRGQFEPGSPRDVPVLWQRGEPERAAVLPFPERRRDEP
ncbi:rhomboid family intramembrane serine protease [Luteimonas sp. 50]|uniref:Rhomboid family intramembrane serine protease n=1 Tax=Cognatiluteimonas sedimenti TaxID=2927791 RepID=A0ABT0A5K8_9GAMM|nr:rhomboid family intramembrane serine protease [Lysobacter sedimenti]MCJ0826271.1 rhomboid family intramembrane serine protease [Lysobacter sedimenti]